MAQIEEVIKLRDGTLTNLVDSNSKLSVNYRPVTTWYDGSVMTTSKVDGSLYKETDEGVFYRKVIDKDGELFLEKNTVAELRSMSDYETLLLKAGVYQGVKLNGYYNAGDTPRSVNYYITTELNQVDDGGSVFVINGIKIASSSPLDISHFGALQDLSFDSYPAFKRLIKYCNRMNFNSDISGEYLFKGDGESIEVFNNIDFNTSYVILDTNGYQNFEIILKANDNEVIDTNLLADSEIDDIMSDLNSVVNNKQKSLPDSSMKGAFVYSEVKTNFRIPTNIETHRLGVNTQTFYYSEQFFIDKQGYTFPTLYNESIPIKNGNSYINRVVVMKSNRKRYIRGGSFICIGSSDYTEYRNIGFKSYRSNNVEFSNMNIDMSLLKNRIGGFIRIEGCSGAVLLDLNFTPSDHLAVSSDSSYCIALTRCEDVVVQNVKSTVFNGLVWGVFVSHFVTNLEVINCNLNRIDSHYRGFNYNVDGCKVGSKGINLCGGGYANITNTSVFDGQSIVSLRPDYAGEFDGVINISRCTLYTKSYNNCWIIDSSVVNDANYNFKMHPNRAADTVIPMGRIVNISDVTFDNKYLIGGDSDKAQYAISRFDASGVFQNVRMGDLNVSNINIINRKNGLSKMNTRLSVLSCYTYEAFMGIKQGFNGNTVSESSSEVKPQFDPIYNLEISVEGTLLNNRPVVFTRGDLSGGSITSVFNRSDNKSGYPLPLMTFINCDNIITITDVYRAHFSVIGSNAIPDLVASRGGFWSYNTRDISNTKLLLSEDYVTGSMFDNGDSYENAVVINACEIDAIDIDSNSINNRLYSFLFGATVGDSTFSPTPYNLWYSKSNINNIYMSRSVLNYLRDFNNVLNTGGYKEINIDLVKSALSGINKTTAVIVNNVSNLPIIRGAFPLRALFRTINITRDYIFNSSESTWKLAWEAPMNGIWAQSPAPAGLNSFSGTYSKIEKQVLLSAIVHSTSLEEIQITIPYAPDVGFTLSIGNVTLRTQNGSTNAFIKCSVINQNIGFQFSYKTI